MSPQSPEYKAALKRREARGGRPLSPKTPKKLPRFIPQISDADRAALKAITIYEDEDIIAFDKPSGLSSQGGRGGGHNLDDMLWALARTNGKRPGLVHRLDRDTSGLILAGKSQPVLSFLGKAMAARQFVKTYLCLVTKPQGLNDQGIIDMALRREDVGREAYMRICNADHKDAVLAVTAYEVVSRNEDAALVRCQPHTGRMHQIRVHLASLGAAIAGDVRYGGALTLSGQPVSRLMLHAQRLEFPHPKGGIKRLQCNLAPDIEYLVNVLKL
jgi:RluA family pseudouridine synthase